MNEGLEELKKLGDEYPSEGDTLWAQYSERFSIIEKELKEGEMEHTLRVRLENINYELVREKQENEKKLKAFDIIKNKKLDVCSFINNFVERNDSYETYVLYFEKPIEIDYCVISEELLTEEEFELVKEALL